MSKIESKEIIHLVVIDNRGQILFTENESLNVKHAKTLAMHFPAVTLNPKQSQLDCMDIIFERMGLGAVGKFEYLTTKRFVTENRDDTHHAYLIRYDGELQHLILHPSQDEWGCDIFSVYTPMMINHFYEKAAFGWLNPNELHASIGSASMEIIKALQLRGIMEADCDFIFEYEHGSLGEITHPNYTVDINKQSNSNGNLVL